MELSFLLMLVIFTVIFIILLIIFIKNIKKDLRSIEKVFLIILFLINMIYGIITVNNIVNEMEKLNNIVYNTVEIVPIGEVLFKPMFNLIIFSITNMIIEIIFFINKKVKAKIIIGITLLIIIFVIWYLLSLACTPCHVDFNTI